MPPYRKRSAVLFSRLLSKRAPRCFFGMKVGTQSLSPRNPDGICNANLSVPSRVRPSGLRIDCDSAGCMKTLLPLTPPQLPASVQGVSGIGGADTTRSNVRFFFVGFMLRNGAAVKPYVSNARCIDQSSVHIRILFPHLIHIKMLILVHKRPLTRKHSATTTGAHSAHSPPARWREPGDRSEDPTQSSCSRGGGLGKGGQTGYPGGSIPPPPGGSRRVSRRPRFEGCGEQKALLPFWKRRLGKVTSCCPTSKQLCAGMINGRKLELITWSESN